MSFWDAVQRALYGSILARLEIMSKQLDELNAKVTDLETAVATSNEKQDTLIAGYAEIRQRLIDLQNEGGATPTQLEELTNRLDVVVNSVTAQTAETDAADDQPLP